MLSAEAYSFRLKSRLAISLSWVAGFTNVVVLLASGHVISHATGTITFFGQNAAEQNWIAVRFFGFVSAMFLAGAVASAIMTEGARRRGMRSKYILPMALEAILLLILLMLIQHQPNIDARTPLYAITGIASFAMGLQNATITRISGAVVRTTHLTGVVTDIGLEGMQLLIWYWDQLRKRRAGRLGRALAVSRRHPSFLRVLLLMSILGSFLFGVVVGTIAWHHWRERSLVMPVAFLMWIVLSDFRTPITDVRELDPLSDSELQKHGIVRSMLPPAMGLYRLVIHDHGREHRAPDFQRWVDRLPDRWLVVILAISPLTRLDDNAILDLQAAAEKLIASHRKLIIGGLIHKQFSSLQAMGVVDLIGAENLCPDIEFAIARGIGLVQEGALPMKSIATSA